MNSDRIQVVHIAPHARGYGGIETLLARHADADAGSGLDAWQVGLFEKSTPEAPGYVPLRFGWQSTPRKMRRAMKEVFAQRPGSITVWHNAWALPWFADVDQSVRRIMVLHANPSYYAGWLPLLGDWLDGVLAVSPGGLEMARQVLPRLSPERRQFLPLPIHPPPAMQATKGPPEDIWVLGCAGRLARAQKRWDRLVPFVAELRRLGMKYRLEIIGSGPLRPWLERQLGDDRNVKFFGFLESSEYWRRIQTWDSALFFSDVEGGPIVLLEAMAAGAPPIYPRIGGSLGDDYAPQIDPRCYYPAGDVATAARAVRDILSSTPAEVAAMRRRAQSLALRHHGATYDRVFADFARRISAMPRISRPPDGGRHQRATDRLPLGFITRLLPGALWR